MKLEIRGVRRPTDGEWDRFWERCPYSTFFHSREWAEIWNIYSKGKLYPEPLLIQFSDGVQLLLPLSARKMLLGLARQYESSPAGTFGGWLALEELTPDHTQILCSYMEQRRLALRWRLNPYDEAASRLKFPEVQAEVTHVLDLAGGFDDVQSRISHGHKSKMKRALREGIVINLACRAADWNEYYSVYQDSLQRWGERASSRYGMELFSEIHRRDSPNVRLWLARHQDRIIAGALCFYSPQHVVYWHGAALASHFEFGGATLLIREVIRHACESGHRWFDFNPSGKLKGVRAFKELFGASELPCPMVLKKTAQSRLWEGIQGTIAFVRNRSRA